MAEGTCCIFQPEWKFCTFCMFFAYSDATMEKKRPIKVFYGFFLTVTNTKMLIWHPRKLVKTGKNSHMHQWPGTLIFEQVITKSIKYSVFSIEGNISVNRKDLRAVVTIVIVPLLLPTLFGKRGTFTHSPLPWVVETFSFHCYRVYLPCFISLNSVLSYTQDWHWRHEP